MARRLVTLAGFCALIAALVVPSAASADTAQVQKMATTYCKVQKKKLGKKGFAKRYGRKAPMKACVKKQRQAVAAAYAQATADCQAELDEFGPTDFYDEWESFDECVQWYAEDYLNPSLPTDDPIDDDSDDENNLF
jgi:hypothetical protein